MTLTFPYSSAPVRQIREIQFGVMSPEEIVSDCLVLPASPPFCRCESSDHGDGCNDPCTVGGDGGIVELGLTFRSMG